MLEGEKASQRPRGPLLGWSRPLGSITGCGSYAKRAWVTDVSSGGGSSLLGAPGSQCRLAHCSKGTVQRSDVQRGWIPASGSRTYTPAPTSKLTAFWKNACRELSDTFFLSKEILLRRAQHVLAAVPREGHSRSKYLRSAADINRTPGILTPILPWRHPQEPEPAQRHPHIRGAKLPPAPPEQLSRPRRAWTQSHPLGSCALRGQLVYQPYQGALWNLPSLPETQTRLRRRAASTGAELPKNRNYSQFVLLGTKKK